MKKLLFASLCLIVGACQTDTGNTLKTVDDTTAPKLEKTLQSGKAVIVGDVYFEDRYCGGSSISMVNVATKEHQLIANGAVVSLGLWKDTAVVKPGTYRITAVKCGTSVVKLGGNWAGHPCRNRQAEEGPGADLLGEGGRGSPHRYVADQRDQEGNAVFKRQGDRDP